MIGPASPGRGRLGRFLSGASYPFRGLHTLLSMGGLLRWAVIPLLVNSLLFAGLAVAAIWAAASYTGGAAGEGWWSGLLAALAGIAAFLAFTVLAFFTVGLTATAISAPFNEILSQAVERRLTGGTGEAGAGWFAAELLRAAWAAAKLFLLEMAVVIPSLLLLLIPLAGPALFGLPASFFAALTFLDYPLDRRKLDTRAKLRFCRTHLAEVMGFGAVVYLAMLIPLVNLLVIPVATVGGTRLFLLLAQPPAAPEGAGGSPSRGTSPPGS